MHSLIRISLTLKAGVAENPVSELMNAVLSSRFTLTGCLTHMQTENRSAFLVFAHNLSEALRIYW